MFLPMAGNRWFVAPDLASGGLNLNTITSLSIGCAIACAGFVTPAQATPATPFTAPAVIVYLSGVDGTQEFLSSVPSSFFDGPYYTYFDDNGTPGVGDDGQRYRAFYGTMKTTADIPLALRGLNLLLTSRSKGGSIWGVDAVARNQAIASMAITNSNGNCALLGGIYRCAEAGIDPPNAPVGGEVIPDFGVSDLEPKMFQAPLNTALNAQLTVSELARLTVKPGNALLIGLPITTSVGNFPLSRVSYAAALTGINTTWSQMGAVPPPAGDDIIVCGRNAGTGAKAAYNWFFGSFGCGPPYAPATMAGILTTGGSGTKAQPFIIDPTQGYMVLEHPTTAGVRNCLAQANNGGLHVFEDVNGQYYSITFAAGSGALGELSLDSLGRENGWTYRTVGAGNLDPGLQTVTGTGVAPTKSELLCGGYEFRVETTFQYRNLASANPLLAGNKKTFIDFFIDRVGASAFNTQNWIAAIPSATNACNTPNTAFVTKSGSTCGALLQVCGGSCP